LTQRFFDVWVVLFFGFAGFLLRRMDYPMAPLVLGIILGDLMDKNLRRGLTLSDGDFTPFFARPISMLFWIVTLLTIVLGIGPARRAITGSVRRLWPGTRSGSIS